MYNEFQRFRIGSIIRDGVILPLALLALALSLSQYFGIGTEQLTQMKDLFLK